MNHPRGRSRGKGHRGSGSILRRSDSSPAEGVLGQEAALGRRRDEEETKNRTYLKTYLIIASNPEDVDIYFCFR